MIKTGSPCLVGKQIIAIYTAMFVTRIIVLSPYKGELGAQNAV